MKKVLFSALCVSALLASCADDELMQNAAPNYGEGEKIDVTLAAAYPDFVGEAGTRMALVGNQWAWTNEDILGAARVAAIDDGSVANTFDTNNPFFLTEELSEPTATATFKSNTAIFAGQYVFYHQYIKDMVGGTTSTNDKFTVEFPTVQVMDPENPTKHLSDENLWVSPVIKIGGIAYEAENETPIEFVSLNAIMELNITNNSNYESLVLNKVEVNGAQLLTEGDLDFTNAFGAAVDASATDYSTKLSGAIEALLPANKDLFESGTKTTTGTKISLILGGEGITLAKGAKATVYVLIPAGKYSLATSPSGMGISGYTIYTDKGQFDVAITDVTSKTTADLNRNTYARFSPVLTGYAETVTSYDINNNEDWKNAVAYALANTNEQIQFNMLKDIEVDELPTCPLYVGGTGKLTLKADKTYTPVNGSYFANLENKGTLNLTEQLYIGSLTNKGTVNIANRENVKGSATQTLSTTWLGAKSYGINTLNNQGTINVNGQLTTAASTTWTNSAKSQTTALGTIQINAEGALNVASALSNAGSIKNSGTIALGAVLTNSANATIEIATATGAVTTTNAGTNNISNAGKIKLDAAKDVFYLVGADGNAAATTTSLMASTSTGTVEAAVAQANIATLPAIEEINSVEMSGAWDIASLQALNAKWSNITAQTWNGVTIDLAEGTNEFNKVTKIVMNGTCALNNSTTKAVELGLASTTAAGEITVNGDLTVAKYVTVGKEQTNTPEIQVLGNMTNNGEVYAAITVGNGPAPNLNTTAKYTNAKNAETHNASGYSGSKYTYVELTYWGTFVNSSEQDHVKALDMKAGVNGVSVLQGTWTKVANS